MVAITFGAARAAAAAVKGGKSKASFWSRFYKALVDARMRAAERELTLHRHLMADYDKDAVFGHNKKR
ncbi:MAG: hypothetical protein JOZ70_10550 [Pseudolabrys sp.]|nr:hypothetical protein [Pseudolabrys sp.]